MLPYHVHPDHKDHLATLDKSLIVFVDYLESLLGNLPFLIILEILLVLLTPLNTELDMNNWLHVRTVFLSLKLLFL